MPDLQLVDTVDGFDICVLAGEPVMDNGLESSSFLSVSTDLSADGGPGFWGDVFTPDTEPNIGNRIFTLKKNSAENRTKAIGYIKEGLQWMVDQSVAKEINVTAESASTISTFFNIEIVKPDFTTENQRFELNWIAQKIRSA